MEARRGAAGSSGEECRGEERREVGRETRDIRRYKEGMEIRKKGKETGRVGRGRPQNTEQKVRWPAAVTMIGSRGAVNCAICVPYVSYKSR
jgi:hypothetical protein